MSTILIITATVIIMISFNALYVAAEFATVAARKTKVSQLAGEGNSAAKELLSILESSKNLDQYVAACQLGITISSLVLGAYGQDTIASRLEAPLEQLFPSFGAETAATISFIGVLAFITILQVVLGELLPKSIAVQYPERVALVVMTPMLITLRILRFLRLITFFNGSGNIILRLLGRPPKEKAGSIHSPEEIELLVSESHEVGFLDDNERQMLRNAFRLRDLTARQVMLHRTKLITAPMTSSLPELMKIAVDAGISRIPLYRDSIDDVSGFVHVKDLFRLHVEGQTDYADNVRAVIHVPDTMPVVALWETLNQKRKYLAIVFDEYGGTAGLVTLEDLIEEVFGELQDEFDDEHALVARDKEGRIYLRADLLVADVNEYLELTLPTEADTLSGLIFSELGRVPNVGDKVKIDAITIQVETMADLGVDEVSLKLPPANEDMSGFSEWEVTEHE